MSLLSSVPFSQPSRMLMHARSATVLAGPPALNPRASRFPSSSSSSSSFPQPLRLFGQIWFTNEIRSDVPITSYPSRLSSLSLSCHRDSLCCYLASFSSASVSAACRFLYLASRFHRIAIVVGFFSRHPVLPRRSLTRLANRPAELGVRFLVVGELPKIFFLPSFATVHRLVMRLSFRPRSAICDKIGM